ncbi:MAG: XRE family transcriptional regulator [Dehalobacter sp.]|nr:XRE family transcriptional regulator [Dehalobacter sp.]
MTIINRINYRNDVIDNNIEDRINVSKFKVGETLKKYRLLNNMTQAFVAQAIGISAAMVSLIERDNVSPSMATLAKLTHFYGINISSIFNNYKNINKYDVIRNCNKKLLEKITLSDGNGHGYCLESIPFRYNSIKMQPYIMSITDDIVVFNCCENNDETIIYVLNGILELLIEEHKVELNEGDFIYMDASLEHKLRSKDGSEVTMLIIKRVVL